MGVLCSSESSGFTSGVVVDDSKYLKHHLEELLKKKEETEAPENIFEQILFTCTSLSPDKVAKRMDQIITENSKDWIAYFCKGAALTRASLFSEDKAKIDAEAASCINKAIELKSDYKPLLVEACKAFLWIEEYNSLPRIADKALALDDISLAGVIGLRLHMNKKYQEAIAVYEKILGKNKSLDFAWANLVNCLNAEKRYDCAIERGNEALKYSPESAFVLLNLGLAYHSKGSLDEAMKFYKKAEETKNSDVLPPIYYNLACVHSLRKHPSAAKHWLAKAISLNPKYIAEAKKDKDFESYSSSEWFNELTKKD